MCSPGVYVMVQGDKELPSPYLLASVGTEKAEVLVIMYSCQHSWVH